MPWVQIVIFLVFIFAGLIFFLRYILSRHYRNVTLRLEELTKDYSSKQAEADKLFRQAKQEYQDITIKAKRDASELRNKIIEEAEQEKDRVIKEAHQRSEDMVSQAERTCEFLKKEIEQKIEEGTVIKACELIKGSLPEELRQELHSLWMKESHKADFQIGRLNLPKDVKEAKITSAFALSKQLKEDLHDKLKKKIHIDVALSEELDPALVAGYIITIGSVVIDASLRYKIQSQTRQNT